MGLILDTNFVITAEREGRRRVTGRVDAFFARMPHESFFINFTIAGELACGSSASDHGYWERLCSPYQMLPWTMEIAWRYGELYRTLAAAGQLIGANDLWIAATALSHGFGVVTANTAEFVRVPGLVVERF